VTVHRSACTALASERSADESACGSWDAPAQAAISRSTPTFGGRSARALDLAFLTRGGAVPLGVRTP
jgi:hypothetical protein